MDNLASKIKKISSLSKKEQIKQLEALLSHIKVREELETIGKFMTINQMLLFLRQILPKVSADSWKLSPLLVGLPHPQFRKILEQASQEDVQILKHECFGEPLQHHLSLLSHELDNELQEIIRDYELLQKIVNGIDIHTFRYKDFTELRSKIENLENELLETEALANHCLALAWHSQQEHLIEILTKVKDGCKRMIIHGIGTYSLEENIATTLLGLLKAKLETPFLNHPSETAIKALDDNDTAFEALTKFGIWYLRDYHALGLLPQVSTGASLDLKFLKLSPEKREELRAKYYGDVEKNLETLGLKSVHDFKKQCIFSKEALLELINKQS